jgi:hypothetical protein
LSTLSQISAVGEPAVAEHTRPSPVALQTQTPVLAQAPVPTLQLPPVANPSSVEPSQSLSSVSHTSGEAVATGTQLKLPAEHVRTPAEQTPGTLLTHEAPPPGLPSSTEPSQSLSTLSQTSAVGEPAVAEHTRPSPVALQTQAPVLAHDPVPTLQLPPVANPSSVAPLQLLSSVSHTSVDGPRFA